MRLRWSRVSHWLSSEVAKLGCRLATSSQSVATQSAQAYPQIRKLSTPKNSTTGKKPKRTRHLPDSWASAPEVRTTQARTSARVPYCTLQRLEDGASNCAYLATPAACRPTNNQQVSLAGLRSHGQVSRVWGLTGSLKRLALLRFAAWPGCFKTVTVALCRLMAESFRDPAEPLWGRVIVFTPRRTPRLVPSCVLRSASTFRPAGQWQFLSLGWAD